VDKSWGFYAYIGYAAVLLIASVIGLVNPHFFAFFNIPIRVPMTNGILLFMFLICAFLSVLTAYVYEWLWGEST
jgi:hypothetical protein